MAATKGAGGKAAVTRAAKDAAARIAESLRRLEGEKRYIDALVGEGILSARDVSTLKKVQRRLAERGQPGRARSSAR
jgi:hypothetical protein